MLSRLICLAALPVGGGLVYSGVVPLTTVLGLGSYSETISAPPAKVSSAIADLQIPEFTDYAGWKPRPVLHRARTETGQKWTLYYGPKRMLVMTATLTPAAGGAATHVRGSIEHGPDYAPDKVPAGLADLNTADAPFAASLEMELNDLMPEPERLTFAQAEERRFAAVTAAAVAHTMAHPEQLMAGACVNKNEVDTPRCKQKRAERKKDDENRARRIREAREEQLASRYGGTYRPQPRVSFQPGKPMIDVSN